jgi:long-subunit acyl-CoA synthetase (AMP-forming)
MSWVIESLRNFAHLRPDAVAVSDGTRCLTYRELLAQVTEVATLLRRQGSQSIALHADNGPEWIVADLAAWYAGAMLVPVPPFFTAEQVHHLFATSRADTVLTAGQTALLYAASSEFERIDASAAGITLFARRCADPGAGRAKPGCCKVTFTSGSTGTPKGVMLSGNTIDAVTRRLVGAFAGMPITRHLCSMPLATLLENIAGVYVPLVRGTMVCVPSLSTLGLYGSSRIDAARFRRTITDAKAESLILQPQTLRELTDSVRTESGFAGMPLRFVAVGGARVADADLVEAASAGIPAYQGYGLSECASVVALNHPNESRRGSVGRPLPGLDVEIASDGEILVTGQALSGYLGEDSECTATVATGDLGHLDEDGFLYVTGRKKDVFITSFGRNVSPEWPEAVLLHEPEVAQACVFGEAMPYNTAVIVPSPTCTAAGIGEAVARANRSLPDYARVTEWIIADDAFSTTNGQLTPTGKPRRDTIARQYFQTPDTEGPCSPPTFRHTPEHLERTNP